MRKSFHVIPAKAGIPFPWGQVGRGHSPPYGTVLWIPAFAGMTGWVLMYPHQGDDSTASILFIVVMNYSGLSPETVTAFCHFAVSPLANLANSAGVIDTAATPFSKNRCLSSGMATAFIIAAYIFVT